MRTVIGIGTVMLVTSCGGLTLRGGDSVKPGREPPGQKLAVYKPVDCVDASTGPVQKTSTMHIVQDAAGRRMLVETTPGYDSLVVKNVFIDRGEIAWQAVMKSKSGRMMLHDYRVPNDFSGPGRMAVASSWREVKLDGGGFRGYFEQPISTCQLALAGPDGNPIAAVPTAPTDAPPVANDAGTSESPPESGSPEPRDSYAVGDVVAVDVQGQSVRAKVVQALADGRYFVEYQTSPPTSEWIDKSRIRGKL